MTVGTSPPGDWVQIKVVGARQLGRNFHTAAKALEEAVEAVLATYQMLIIGIAREIAGDHIETAAMIGSIAAVDSSGKKYPQSSAVEITANSMSASVGMGGEAIFGPGTGLPADPQSWLLEFGFRHWISGAFIQYPILAPSLDAIRQPFLETLSQVPRVLQGVTGVNSMPTDISKWISATRSDLYSLSRTLGDVQVFTGSPFLSSFRSYALMLSRALGDTNALMKGGIATSGRISTRIAGRGVTGTFRTSFNIQGTYGSASTRIYNRFAGRGFGLGLRQLTITR